MAAREWQITEYPLQTDTTDEQVLVIPREAKVRNFRWKGGIKWQGAVLLVHEHPGTEDRPNPSEERTFRVYPTGDNTIPGGMTYCGTTHDGEFHCFEKPPPF